MPTPPTNKELLAYMRQVLLPVLQKYCSKPQEAFSEAVRISDYGRNAFAFNFWHLLGKGDGGFYYSYTPVYTNQIKNGGIEPKIVVVAKFATIDSAVLAYCACAGCCR